MKIPLTGGDYNGRSLDSGSVTCLNLYPERMETKEGVTDTILIGCPGQSEVLAWNLQGVYPNEKCRGLHPASWGVVFGLFGNHLVRFDDENSVPVYIGLVGSSGIYTPVKMCDNGKSLVIVDGYGLYVSDRGSTSVAKIDLGSRIPTHCLFLGGYIAINNTYLDPAQDYPPSNMQIFYSALGDAHSFPLSNFVVASGAADPVTSIQKINDQIWAQGEQGFEIFTESGDANIPFQRLGASYTGTGLIAPYSTVTMGNTLFWIGINVTGGVTVFRSKSMAAERISTHAQEFQLTSPVGQAQAVRDCIAWVYSKEGHDFVIFTSSNLNLTLVWDDAENEWHRRSKHNYITTGEDQYEPIYAASLRGKSYCAMRDQAKMMELDLDKYDDWDGDVIVREHTLPIVCNELQGIVHDQVKLQMETGYGSGDPASLAYKPQATLYQSNDAGHTWSSGTSVSIGESGEFGKRVIWWRRGYARLRQYRIRITAPVKQVWIAAYIESQALIMGKR